MLIIEFTITFLRLIVLPVIMYCCIASRVLHVCVARVCVCVSRVCVCVLRVCVCVCVCMCRSSRMC